MKAEQLFHKALLLLDSGHLDRGEAALRSAIETAREDEDLALLVRALVCLADLLSQSGRFSEAQIVSCETLSYKNDPRLSEIDDVLEQEFALVTELMGPNSSDGLNIDTCGVASRFENRKHGPVKSDYGRTNCGLADFPQPNTRQV